MDLSRKAKIVLSRPKQPGLSENPNYQPPKIIFLHGPWHITYSTAKSQPVRRNVKPEVAVSTAQHTVTVDTKWQNVGSPDVHSETSKLTHENLNPAQASASRFRVEGSSEVWEVLAWGKEGQLDSWMTDDGDGWISDSSGERRGDWRNSYLVIYRKPTGSDSLDRAELQIWSRFGKWKMLTSETIKAIRSAIGDLRSDEELRTLGQQLAPLGVDD